MLLAQGQLAEALQVYRDSLAIAERLAKADPANAGWQRGLSVAYDKVANVLVAHGQLAEALQVYRDSLAIRVRLAKADPENAQWQWDVVISHWKLATQGDEPARRWAFIVAEMHRLKAEGRLRPDWERSLPTAEANLAKVKAAQAAPQ